jgi:hypothetical protein
MQSLLSLWKEQITHKSISKKKVVLINDVEGRGYQSIFFGGKTDLFLP